jgi:hypothetical protein
MTLNANGRDQQHGSTTVQQYNKQFNSIHQAKVQPPAHRHAYNQTFTTK